MPSEEIMVNTNATLRNVFVYISSGLGARRFPLPLDSVIIDQRGCRYSPHVFGMRVGQPLVLMNSDNTFHNIFAAAKVNRPFNLGMTLSVRKLTRTFERPEVMIPLRCNVHPWMAAYIGVLEHPFFAVTDSSGKFRLSKLPAGTYELTAWHERFGVSTQSVALGDTASLQFDFRFISK